MICATLPLPPSANRMWRKARNRVHIAPAYEAWKASAGLILNVAAAGKRIDGPYALSLRVGCMTGRRLDLDNYLKPVNDLLQSCGAIRNDSDCQAIDLAWATGVQGAVVTVTAADLIPRIEPKPKRARKTETASA